MRYVDLSVIIPTLNEEKFIGTLLDSIFYQTVWPKEIIIIDAFSTDKTEQVVDRRRDKLPQLQFVQIPKYTISRQRNYGVSLTSNAHILFLDADMKLKDKDTLEKYVKELEIKRPHIAAATNLPLSDSWKDKIYFLNMNLAMRAAKPFWPWTTGMNLYVQKAAFGKVKGFDEEVRVGEDMELVQRMVKKGFKFIFLDEPKIYTSVRRFVKEGRRRYTLKIIKAFFQANIKGYKDIDIEYEMGSFNHLPRDRSLLERFIKQVEKQRFTLAIMKIKDQIPGPTKVVKSLKTSFKKGTKMISKF